MIFVAAESWYAQIGNKLRNLFRKTITFAELGVLLMIDQKQEIKK